MKVLLRNKETQLYYAGPNQWTPQTDTALDFGQIERAAQAYASENLTFAEIVIEENPASDSAVLTEATRQLTQ